MDNKELCFVAYCDLVYQKYVPYYVYFCNRAYPESKIKIFLDCEIDKSLRSSFDLVSKNSNVSFYDNTFKDIPHSITKLKASRFLLDSSYFKDIKYIYIGDIDLFISKEKISLLEQHLIHCNETSLCYSNAVRDLDYNRLTGLHFIKTDEYFEKMDAIITKYYEALRAESLSVSDQHKGCLDEMMLYKMVEEANCGFPKNYFRPHHGLHIGVWRKKKPFSLSQEFLNEHGHDNYINYYRDFLEAEKEDGYKLLLKNIPLDEIIRMKQCLKISL